MSGAPGPAGEEVTWLRARLAEVTRERDAYVQAMHELVTAIWKVQSMVKLARNGRLGPFDGEELARLERVVSGLPTEPHFRDEHE